LQWVEEDPNIDGYPVYYVETTKEGAPAAREFYDRLGRAVKTETAVLDIGGSAKTVYSSNEYDDKGRLTKTISSGPVAGLTASTEYTYDWAGRTISKTSTLGNAVTTLSYTYSDRAVETFNITKGQSIKKTFDAAGNVILVEENLNSGNDKEKGRIEYKYNSNGKPCEIKTNNEKPISISYDKFGNQIGLNDPNAGVMSYKYNAFGELTEQTDAKNTFKMEYDALGRLVKKTNQTDNNYTSYIYDKDPANESSKCKGLPVRAYESKTDFYKNYIYDNKSRLIKETENLGEGQQFSSEYSYNDEYNRLLNVTYPSGIKTENYYSDLGYLKEIKRVDNGFQQTIWKAEASNNSEITGYSLGPNGLLQVNKTLDDDFGFSYTTNATYNNNSIQKFSYIFEPSTGNLMQRKRYSGAYQYQKELFEYDKLDRLKNITYNNSMGVTNEYSMDYELNGNIKNKYDVSAKDYVYSKKQPNALEFILESKGEISSMKQDITYNAYNLIETIKEKEKNKDNITNEMKFYYGADEMRKKVETYKKTGENELELQSLKYYSGAYEKEIKGATTTEWTYIYGATGLAAVYRQVNGTGAMYYALTDHLGSITGLVNENGELAEEYSYDAWGRRRKPDIWTDYTVTEPTLISRGYTGHEHLDMFALINMNGRLYDPLLGRMLSPDNFVQSPMFSQSYNRFAYCVNNPLKYTDPSGENINPYSIFFPTFPDWLIVIFNGYFPIKDVTIIANKIWTIPIIPAKDNPIIPIPRGGGGGGAGTGTGDGDGITPNPNNDKPPKDNERPDKDGKLTFLEALNWYNKGKGISLFVDIKSIDLGKVTISDFKNVPVGADIEIDIGLRGKYFTNINDALVYGVISLQYLGNNTVQIKNYRDVWDLEYEKSWKDNFLRNIEVSLGLLITNKGTPYNIYIYGQTKIK
ncbi:MAG: hypothetical protein KA792_03660, partial [Bacteroidales bacterium]|nr:hypothetical protein [Bacteroidales bacterium]